MGCVEACHWWVVYRLEISGLCGGMPLMGCVEACYWWVVNRHVVGGVCRGMCLVGWVQSQLGRQWRER